MKVFKLKPFLYRAARYGEAGFHRNEIAERLGITPRKMRGIIHTLERIGVIDYLGKGYFKIKEDVELKQRIPKAINKDKLKKKKS